MEFLYKLFKTGPDAQISWDLGTAWDYFLRGDAIFTYSWGDVGSLVQDESRSKIKGKMGAAVLPGSYEVYDRCKGEFVKWMNQCGRQQHWRVVARRDSEFCQR